MTKLAFPLHSVARGVTMSGLDRLKSALVLAAIAIGSTSVSLSLQRLFPLRPVLILAGPILAAVAVVTVFHRAD